MRGVIAGVQLGLDPIKHSISEIAVQRQRGLQLDTRNNHTFLAQTMG